MTARVLRMFFDRGVVFVPADGRVLLTFHGEEAHALDLTTEIPFLLGAGLAGGAKPSQDTPSRPDIASDAVPIDCDGTVMVDVAMLELPDRMRVYYDGRRLSAEEVGAAVERTVRLALRTAVSAYTA